MPAARQDGIWTQDLTRQFAGGVGLDGLSIDVEPGEVLALLGPNGAGKTTTVRLLNGVLRRDRGEAYVLGLDPATQGEQLRRRTGVLTEHAGLDDRLTARENLHYQAMVRGMRGVETERRITELIERFGMGSRIDQPVRGASTGQRKRLGLALALLHDPDVLFLDEPTSGLDPSATRDVVALIANLARQHGRSVVLATHFLGEAGQLADRMAVLDRGRLVAFGRPEDLAAELWDGIEVDIDLGGADRTGTASDTAVGAARDVPGVLSSLPTHGGLTVRVEDRTVVARVVAALVRAGVDVYAAVPRPPTLEDVYFEIEARHLAKLRAAGEEPAEPGVARPEPARAT